MARANRVEEFQLCHQIIFETNIRSGHNVYKSIWTPTMGEVLQVKYDQMEEALKNDEHALGVYNNKGLLVGHVLIELSSLLYFFLQAAIKKIVYSVK